MTVTATELKNRLGQYLQKAQKRPVIIKKSGRPSLVLLSIEDFETLEDHYLGSKAREAKKKGLLSVEESEKFLHKWLNEVS